MGKKWRKMLSPTYSLKFKNIILFLNQDLHIFSNGHNRNVVSTLPKVVKTDVENDNVVSTLSNVAQFNVEKHNVVSTLFYIVNFNIDIHNVVSTLIWRCVTSRRHIKLKTTLNRCWNVCWDRFEGLLHVGILIRTRIIDFTMEWHVISLNEAPLKSIKSYF